MTYPHETFNTEGCGIPSITLSEEQKDVIKTVMDGNAFINPIADKITDAKGKIETLLGQIPSGGAGAGGILDYTALSTQLTSLTEELGTLEGHADRLSGVNLSNDGELFGFQGLQGVATAFNGIQETMKDVGGAVTDNFSQMFGSVLGAGQNMTNDIASKLGSIDIAGLEDQGQQAIDDLVGEMTTAVSDISSSILSDNNHLGEALDSLKKFGLGNTVLGMDKDKCFGDKILSQIGSDELKSKLNGLL